MRFLKQAWEDVKRGESIDLYATVLLALALTVLSLLGLAPQTLIASITLTVLGLLAISALGNRHRLDELHKSIVRPPSSIFLEEYPSTLDAEFKSGKVLWLVGVTLKATIGGKYVEIENQLRQGQRINVLLLHPTGAAVEIAAERYYAGANRNPQKLASRILDTIQVFCDLQQIAPDRVEIRTIQNPLTFGAIAIDPESSSGSLYLEHYPFRTVSGALPKFVLRTSDRQWYELFKREIYALWEEGKVWDCNQGTGGTSPTPSTDLHI